MNEGTKKPAKPLIADLLKEERLSMKNPISFCGHHCGFVSVKTSNSTAG